MKGLGRTGRNAEDESRVVREYLQQFKDIPILDGTLATGVVGTGLAYVLIRHGLGRSYVGGVQVACDTSTSFVIQDPGTASATGTDVQNFVVVFCPAPVAADTTVTVWVF